jgi:hypothetical protein
MLGKPVRWWKVSAAALVYLAPVFGVAMAQGSAPTAPGSAPAAQFSVDAATLRRFVGHYRLGDADIQGVMTVTLSGTQLAVQFTGNPSTDIYPQSATHFILKGVSASVDFVTAAKGPATALILHSNTPDLTLHRMDDAAAVQFNAKVAARVQSNTPQPGSQAAIGDFISRIEKGQPPDYSQMGPELAEAAKAQAEQTASAFSSLGAFQSLTFQRVAPNGADIFQAKFANGVVQIFIALDSKGIITTMAIQPAQ